MHTTERTLNSLAKSLALVVCGVAGLALIYALVPGPVLEMCSLLILPLGVIALVLSSIGLISTGAAGVFFDRASFKQKVAAYVQEGLQERAASAVAAP